MVSQIANIAYDVETKNWTTPSSDHRHLILFSNYVWTLNHG